MPTSNAPLNSVFRKLEELKLDALLISNQANITYLTNFPSQESYLLLSKKEKIFITDFRYIQQVKKSLKGFFSFQKINGSVFTLVGRLCSKLNLRSLGFEARHLCFAEYEKIKENLKAGIDLTPTYNLIEPIREIKTENELKKIKKAIKITIQAFQYAQTIITPGIRERELANKLEYFIRKRGVSSSSFEIIVASGENSSFPHHMTSNRKLKSNEPVLIDMGVSFQGYKSDLTRIFFLGRITPIIKRIYNIVLKAQAKAIRYIKPGISINKIDNIARQYIVQRGYGSHFGHNLGHGIGLEVHEEPHISSKNKDKLAAGMVFTVEPAIYLPSKFGLRIEDMVLVTKKGVKVLSGSLNKSI